MTSREANIVTQDKEGGFKVDNKIRRNIKYPVGPMDVLSVVKTNEHYRVLYDVKGRFILHKIKEAESKYKLVKVTARSVGSNKVPYIVTNDARTIRYPHPDISIGDTIKIDLEKNTILEQFKYEPGHLSFVTGGNNIGRVGQVVHV